ncbi:MAG: glycine oxidase ThiO [Dehalococcoidia bacterium]
MIALTVNGKPRELEGETPLPDFLRSLGVDQRAIAVAVNGEVVPKKQYRDIVLRAGDEVEVVRMVGGGAVGRGSRVEGQGSRRRRGVSAPGGDVVVVGAGIIGCAIAYELSRRGVSCVVLDSRRLGMAATNAAAGILAPLAEFRRPGALVRAGLESLRLYPTWVERLREEAPDIDVEFALNGVLRVAFAEDELAELRGGLRYRNELGVELIELDAAQLREAEPRLSDKLIGGVLCPEEGQVSNQLFTLALSRAARKRGARFVEFAPVLGFRRSAGRVTAVRTPKGELACDHLVLAAGAWTRPIARRLGVEVPTYPVRGQMLALGRMMTPIHQPVWGPRGYVLPRANGLVFAGATVEEVGFRIRTTARGLAGVRSAAFELVPQLRHAREHFSWAGLRPGSPDGLPMLGPLPGWENVTLATGHFRNGILLAPFTGELIARAIIEGRPSDALAPFDPGRFGGPPH